VAAATVERRTGGWFASLLTCARAMAATLPAAATVGLTTALEKSASDEEDGADATAMRRLGAAMAALGAAAEDAVSRAAIVVVGSSGGGGCGRDPCGDEDRLDGCDEFELDRMRRTSADAGSSPPPKATGRFRYCAGGICALLGRLSGADARK
jgi:hypothetical protein